VVTEGIWCRVVRFVPFVIVWDGLGVERKPGAGASTRIVVVDRIVGSPRRLPMSGTSVGAR
jgi:hypothetical protein